MRVFTSLPACIKSAPEKILFFAMNQKVRFRSRTKVPETAAEKTELGQKTWFPVSSTPEVEF